MKIPDSWVISEAFIIRHKPTGFVIPQPNYRTGRGGSHVEPMDPKKSTPRLFYSLTSARAYLGQWLRGKMTCTRYSDGEEVFNLTPQPNRTKDNMEIIPVVLIPKEI